MRRYVAAALLILAVAVMLAAASQPGERPTFTPATAPSSEPVCARVENPDGTVSNCEWEQP